MASSRPPLALPDLGEGTADHDHVLGRAPAGQSPGLLQRPRQRRPGRDRLEAALVATAPPASGWHSYPVGTHAWKYEDRSLNDYLPRLMRFFRKAS